VDEHTELNITLVGPDYVGQRDLFLIPYPARRHREIVHDRLLKKFLEEQDLVGRRIAVIACDQALPIVRKGHVGKLLKAQAQTQAFAGCARWQTATQAHEDLYEWARPYLPRPGYREAPNETGLYSTDGLLDSASDNARQGIWNQESI